MARRTGPGPDPAPLNQNRVGRPGIRPGHGRRRSGAGVCDKQDCNGEQRVGPHGPRDDTEAMGFNPQRTRTRRPSDFVYVGAAIAVAVMLVAWALFL